MTTLFMRKHSRDFTLKSDNILIYTSAHNYVSSSNRVRKIHEPVNWVLGTQRSKLESIQRLEPGFLTGTSGFQAIEEEILNSFFPLNHFSMICSFLFFSKKFRKKGYLFKKLIMGVVLTLQLEDFIISSC